LLIGAEKRSTVQRVLEDLAALQAEGVNHRLAAGIIGQAVPMTVKDNVVAVGKDSLDLAASIG